MTAEVKERHRRAAAELFPQMVRVWSTGLSSWVHTGDVNAINGTRTEPMLAQAIAHAEADALERAAQECERMAQSWCIRLNEQDWLPNVASASENTAYELADRIRALKEAP